MEIKIQTSATRAQNFLGILTLSYLISRDKVRFYFDISGHAGRYPILDLLRAVAIIWVLLRHWIIAHRDFFQESTIQLPKALNSFFANGWIGVDLFFVLSGFLISSHFIQNKNRNLTRHSIRDFYLRRALRTLPLYWGVILLSWMCADLLGAANFSMASFSTHFLFLQDYLSSDVLITLWSLAVEEKFYLLAPILGVVIFKIGEKYTKALIAMLVILIFYSMCNTVSLLNPTSYEDFFWNVRAPFHHSVLSILVGVFVALNHEPSEASRPPLNRPRQHIFRFSAVALCLCLLHTPAEWMAINNWYIGCFIIFLSAVLFGLLTHIGLQINLYSTEFGSNRTMRAIAKLSYALYLVHYPMIRVTKLLLSKINLPNEMPYISEISFFLVYLGLSWICACLLHFLLEKPFLLMRNRLSNKVEPAVTLAL